MILTNYFSYFSFFKIFDTLKYPLIKLRTEKLKKRDASTVVIVLVPISRIALLPLILSMFSITRLIAAETGHPW